MALCLARGYLRTDEEDGKAAPGNASILGIPGLEDREAARSAERNLPGAGSKRQQRRHMTGTMSERRLRQDGE